MEVEVEGVGVGVDVVVVVAVEGVGMIGVRVIMLLPPHLGQVWFGSAVEGWWLLLGLECGLVRLLLRLLRRGW